ncbi:VOC family protein [Nonomuraea sp. B19D2]|uniref:VOC family protein n=1 Tax=Nonomuraea sp. B19D2 TaxID=3159561 RepID=UPI0032DBCDB7
MPGIHHYGLTVADVDRSVHFYRALWPDAEVSPIEPGDDPRPARLVAVPDAGLRGAMLTAPGGVALEILKYASAQGRRLDTRPCDVPTTHLAIAVDDLDAAARAVAQAGGRAVGAPVDFEAGRYQYCADPDGHFIELIEPAQEDQ